VEAGTEQRMACFLEASALSRGRTGRPTCIKKLDVAGFPPLANVMIRNRLMEHYERVMREDMLPLFNRNAPICFMWSDLRLAGLQI